MANQEYLDILRQGTRIWNQWREEHPDIQPDLSEANISGTAYKQVNDQMVELSLDEISTWEIPTYRHSSINLIDV